MFHFLSFWSETKVSQREYQKCFSLSWIWSTIILIQINNEFELLVCLLQLIFGNRIDLLFGAFNNQQKYFGSEEELFDVLPKSFLEVKKIFKCSRRQSDLNGTRSQFIELTGHFFFEIGEKTGKTGFASFG